MGTYTHLLLLLRTQKIERNKQSKDRTMVKINLLPLAYFLAIFTIFHAASLPLTDTRSYGAAIQNLNSIPIELPTVEEIEEIMALNDPAKKMNRIQKYGVDTVKNLMDFSQSTVKEVDALLKQSEVALIRLKAESATLNLEEFDFTKNFITKFNEAKLNLLEARRELVSLASETVLLCDNIEIGIRDWQDKYASALLKNQFNQLERLIDETKTKLSFAREKYAALIDTWLTIDEDIAVFKLKINKATDTSSEEYEAWTTKVRAAYISGASAVTVGMVIADIFGCLGICSGVVSTITWGSTITSAEMAISNYGSEIERVETQVDNAIERLGKLDLTTKDAVKLINNEMNLVITWQAAAKNVENTMNDFQNIFANSIGKLKTAAQNFHDFASSTRPSL